MCVQKCVWVVVVCECIPRRRMNYSCAFCAYNLSNGNRVGPQRRRRRWHEKTWEPRRRGRVVVRGAGGEKKGEYGTRMNARCATNGCSYNWRAFVYCYLFRFFPYYTIHLVDSESMCFFPPCFSLAFLIIRFVTMPFSMGYCELRNRHLILVVGVLWNGSRSRRSEAGKEIKNLCMSISNAAIERKSELF